MQFLKGSCCSAIVVLVSLHVSSYTFAAAAVSKWSGQVGMEQVTTLDV